MANFDSYQAIVSAVQEVAEDNSQEFIDYIPKAMELAQYRLQDEIDLDLLNQQIELTCVPSNKLILKPSGFRFMNNLFITTSAGTETQLDRVSYDYLRDYWPTASTGTPVKYAIDAGAAYIAVAPTPSSAYVLSAEVRVDVSILSPTNTQNWFTEYCPNALFFATMVEQETFAKNPQAAAEFEQKYTNAIQGINNRGRRARRQDGGTASTTESGKNTLLGTK